MPSLDGCWSILTVRVELVDSLLQVLAAMKLDVEASDVRSVGCVLKLVSVIADAPDRVLGRHS